MEGEVTKEIIDKYMDLSDCEKDHNKDKYGYVVCLKCGQFNQLGSKQKKHRSH